MKFWCLTRILAILDEQPKLGFSVENTSAITLTKKYRTPFVIQHSQGLPENMQNKPIYKNEYIPPATPQ